jgi:hypothetical protein
MQLGTGKIARLGSAISLFVSPSRTRLAIKCSWGVSSA